MKNLRIAFLLDSGPRNWASQEVFHFSLCRELVARGASPVLVYSGKMSEEVLSRMRDSGAEVITEARLQGMRHYYRVLSSTFKKFDINCVHIRYFNYYSIVPWLVRSCSVRNIVYTEASGWLPSERGRWHWKRQLNYVRTKVACQPIQRFIAISNFVRNRAIRNGVNPYWIRVVYNGIDADRFAANAEVRSAWRAKHDVDENEVVISNVNRLDPIKDIQTIVHAVSELIKRNVPARLFVAGTGKLEEELKTLSQGLGLTDRVHWLGHLENPIPLFQASDIFTLASVGEAFGFVLAEAMACGVPCVGSQCGGISEVIEEGRTGLLATPQDPSSFADAYERLAVDIDLRSKMGRESIDRVRRLFRVEKAVENTLAIYEELLD